MQTTRLPRVTDEGEYLAVTRDPEVRGAVARAVASRHELQLCDVEAFAGGSLLVLSLGHERVLKLYSPLEPEDYETELAALRVVQNRLPAQTPRVLATGALDGWPYLVMTRVPGEPANRAWRERRPVDDVWRSIPQAQQIRIAREVGEATRALHSVPTSELPPRMTPDWSAFIAAQRASCVARMKARGLPSEWLRQIPDFLDSVELQAPAAGVLLHTELMRDHVLVQESEDGWRLTGLIDFEPAMVGAPEYELASVGVFLAGDRSKLFRAFLRGYGLPDGLQDHQLAHRVLAYLLLHRFGDLHWAMNLLRVPPGVTTLTGLAEAWWWRPR